MLLNSKGQTKEKVTGFLLARADGHHCKAMILFKAAPIGGVYREVNQFNTNSLGSVTQKKNLL